MPLETDGEIDEMRAVKDRNGDARPPANNDTLSSELSREIATWTAGTLPVEQQTPVQIEDSTGTNIDPATEQSVGQVQDALGNFASGIDFEQTDDTTGGYLPSNAIPHGIEVIVQAKHGNDGNIKVGLTSNPTVALSPGQASHYRVTNTDQIYILATATGDGVNVSAEVTA